MSSYWQDELDALHEAFVGGNMGENDFARKLFTFYPDAEEHSHALYAAQQEREQRHNSGCARVNARLFGWLDRNALPFICGFLLGAWYVAQGAH